jgi:hypothetical protein
MKTLTVADGRDIRNAPLRMADQTHATTPQPTIEEEDKDD